MKGKQNKKEAKQAKSVGKTKVLSEYQLEKRRKPDTILNIKPQI
jgi:hypothetical protein